MKDFGGGGSSLGPLGVKNKVSKDFGGGVTDFLWGESPPPKKKTGLQETLRGIDSIKIPAKCHSSEPFCFRMCMFWTCVIVCIQSDNRRSPAQLDYIRRI